MARKNSLFLFVSLILTLIPCLLIIYYKRPEAERFPILLGWSVSSLNFTTAVIINMMAMKKSFESFKLIVFAGSGARMGVMLAALFIIIKLRPLWTMPFSFSLLSCFGIYIMLEVILFYLKSKRTMS
jgi:hypothetical protein